MRAGAKSARAPRAGAQDVPAAAGLFLAALWAGQFGSPEGPESQRGSPGTEAPLQAGHPVRRCGGEAVSRGKEKCQSPETNRKKDGGSRAGGEPKDPMEVARPARQTGRDRCFTSIGFWGTSLGPGKNSALSATGQFLYSQSRIQQACRVGTDG